MPLEKSRKRIHNHNNNFLVFYDYLHWIKLLEWWIVCSGEDCLRGRKVTACIRASHGCQDTATTSVSLSLPVPPNLFNCLLFSLTLTDMGIFLSYLSSCLSALVINHHIDTLSIVCHLKFQTGHPHGFPPAHTLHWNPPHTDKHTCSYHGIYMQCKSKLISFSSLHDLWSVYSEVVPRLQIVSSIGYLNQYLKDSLVCVALSLISYITKTMLKFSLLWITHNRTEAPRGLGKWPNGSMVQKFRVGVHCKWC